MLATAGSCLFGLFGVQRPPRQILVVRLSIHLNVTRSDASGMGGIGQSPQMPCDAIRHAWLAS